MELKGKIISFLGDSITEGVGVENKLNRYDNVILNKCELKQVYNYGVSGTRIAHQIKPSEKPRHDLNFCGRAYDINSNSDIIVVYGGVNDYIHGDAYFGKLTDKTPETFCGAVYFLMNLLTEKYKNAKILFLTPAHLCYDIVRDYLPSPRKMKKEDAKPLNEYGKVIEKIGKSFNIPVLNLYECLNINPNNISDKQEYTIDGLHFNDKGHQLLADLIIEYLRNIEE